MSARAKVTERQHIALQQCSLTAMRINALEFHSDWNKVIFMNMFSYKNDTSILNNC